MAADVPVMSANLYHIMEHLNSASWGVIDWLALNGFVSITNAIPYKFYSITEKGKQSVKDYFIGE